MKYPLVKLPQDIDTTLYLIRAELKSRKLFHALHEVGLDDCYFQPDLDYLILRSVGLDDGADDTFRIYNEIVDRRSRKIEADHDSVTKQAFKVYQELMMAKKKRAQKQK